MQAGGQATEGVMEQKNWSDERLGWLHRTKSIIRIKIIKINKRNALNGFTDDFRGSFCQNKAARNIAHIQMHSIDTDESSSSSAIMTESYSFQMCVHRQ